MGIDGWDVSKGGKERGAKRKVKPENEEEIGSRIEEEEGHMRQFDIHHGATFLKKKLVFNKLCNGIFG